MVLLVSVCVYQVEAAEKALERPPRLGKHKYDPHAAPTAVLTSDEVTGSLRQLSPCFLVTKDRFLSLQKRGVIEPRKPAVAKKARRVEYVVGARREKAEAGQAELVAARKARQAAKKKQKGNSLAAAVADW
jgi:nucleolar protein 53